MAKEFDTHGITKEKLSGTKTEQNLHTALSGESQAYLRYKWFEWQARQDGYQEIADIFAKTAANEKEHAEIWFRFLGGWKQTEENLKVAAAGEHFEWSEMYAQFAKEAREEGFEFLAGLFERVGAIEKAHEQRYEDRRASVEGKTVFRSDDATTRWLCLNCGHVVEGKDAPMMCPVCQHEQAYFEKMK